MKITATAKPATMMVAEEKIPNLLRAMPTLFRGLQRILT
jgi:hypothetical protein